MQQRFLQRGEAVDRGAQHVEVGAVEPIAATLVEDEQARLAQDFQVLAHRRDGERGELREFTRRARFVNAGADEQSALGMRKRTQDFVEIDSRGVSPG